jgi:hypothetical protein
LALDIEQSLIERKYFEISKGMTTEMKKVIMALVDETEGIIRPFKISSIRTVPQK